MVFLLCNRILFGSGITLQALKELSPRCDMADIIILILPVYAPLPDDVKLDQNIQDLRQFRLGDQIILSGVFPDHIIIRDVGPPQDIHDLRPCQPVFILLNRGHGRLGDIGAVIWTGL